MAVAGRGQCIVDECRLDHEMGIDPDPATPLYRTYYPSAPNPHFQLRHRVNAANWHHR